MVFDPANFRLIKRVNGCKYRLCQSGSANSSNITIPQTGTTMRLSFKRLPFQRPTVRFSFGCLALCFSIQSILNIRAKIKVIWINAKLVVAPRAIVQNVHSIWNSAPVHNPRCSMRPNCGTSPSTSSHRTISGAVDASRPEPTSVRFSYPEPETVREVQRQPLRVKILRCNLDLHNQFIWLCRALGRFSAAEAFQL